MSADRRSWFLINASPDSADQLAASPDLHPTATRGTPVEAILLTNADLDHVLGLFILRENGGIAVRSTPAVWDSLNSALRMNAVLAAFGEVAWTELSDTPEALNLRSGTASGLSCRAIPLPGGPPPYAPATESISGHSIALEITDQRSGHRLLVAPDLAEATPDFRRALKQADAILVDGTFWSDDELSRLRSGARSATEMGHLPIATGTLELMRDCPARFKGYVHINNTNPILLPQTAERAAVESAGIVVSEDGWEFEL